MTAPISFPVPEQKFPAAFKKALQDPEGRTESFALLGKDYPCQVCERSFKLVEAHPNDPSKKSKSWAIGLIIWGKEDPSCAEVFLIKCPTCGNAVMCLPISQRTRLKEAFEGKPAQAAPTVGKIETKKTAAPQPAPQAAPQPTPKPKPKVAPKPIATFPKPAPQVPNPLKK